MDHRALHTGWELVDAPGGPVPATVPGCVHTDLLAAGRIPDPYLGTNETALTWIGDRDWTYRRVFDVPSHHSPARHGFDSDQAHGRGRGAGAAETVPPRRDLVFDGLDTIAEISVDGEHLAGTANQHRRYRLPVDDLAPGPHTLQVRFSSARAHGEAERERLGHRPGAYTAPYQYLRKSACNFGWDWGPDVVTAGIWRPVALETWSTARLSAVRPVATVHGATGTVLVHVSVEHADPQAPSNDLQLRVTLDRHTTVTPVAGSRAEISVTAEDVELWWPHDLGGQPLYPLSVELLHRGAVLDTARHRIGFRTVELDTTPDAIGAAFRFVVNGVPVWIRGANWIPDDCFPSRMTTDRLESRIDQAVGAHLNLLRVWGGGLYESDEFYRLCDEKGVLVWQDFLFACAAYPEEEPLRSEVLAEARDNVTRLMPHPSLALWNGNNENLWGHEEWGWQDDLGDRTWGAGYYHELLPAVVAELDPARPYCPGSPWSPAGVPANADSHGPRHIWDVWNEKDYTAYRDVVPRFAAEFGYQAPPTATTLHRALPGDPLLPDSPGMIAHQKAIDGNLKLARGAEPHLPEAVDDADAWLYLMQVQQAEAIRFGIEHLRSHRDVCGGAIVWQLNDCWPVTSWSAIDGDGRRKLLWYALRDTCAPRLLTVQPRAGALAAVAVNESRAEWSDEIVVQRTDLIGNLQARWTARVTVPALSGHELALPEELITPGDAEREVLLVRTAGHRAAHFFVPDKDLRLPDPGITVQTGRDGDDLVLRVAARRYARHVAVFADRLAPGAVADSALFDLVPGERRTVRIRGAAGVREAVTGAPVLRHLAGINRAVRDPGRSSVPAAALPMPAGR
ncbi:glycoside hydrolase family 2 protein [Nakamurella alba]|nr:glycoside hydrolase family 2 protein [Nakamurella alba]